MHMKCKHDVKTEPTESPSAIQVITAPVTSVTNPIKKSVEPVIKAQSTLDLSNQAIAAKFYKKMCDSRVHIKCKVCKKVLKLQNLKKHMNLHE